MRLEIDICEFQRLGVSKCPEPAGRTVPHPPWMRPRCTHSFGSLFFSLKPWTKSPKLVSLTRPLRVLPALPIPWKACKRFYPAKETRARGLLHRQDSPSALIVPRTKLSASRPSRVVLTHARTERESVTPEPPSPGRGALSYSYDPRFSSVAQGPASLLFPGAGLQRPSSAGSHPHFRGLLPLACTFPRSFPALRATCRHSPGCFCTDQPTCWCRPLRASGRGR